MQKDFDLLNDDEVLYVRAGRVLMPNATFKVSEFLDALAQVVLEQEAEWSEEQEGWFTDRGQRCEVLRFGTQGWQRGRVRLRLEFCPAEERPKLLQESMPRRESLPPREAPSREDPYRRQSREDIYRRDSYSGSPYDPRGSREEIYPDILPEDDY
ncbi:MAG TPA: KGK domain-containing protein [Coleofasciculaceae cyanobacterium]